mgnify:CR=1 FL=1
MIPAKQEMEVKMAEKLRITLVKSPIGAVPKHRKTVEAMGLTKMHKTVELPNNDATMGMVQQVRHLVKVEEA